ncbi:phosphotransferase [Streptomyces sp. NPDC055607]
MTLTLRTEDRSAPLTAAAVLAMASEQVLTAARTLWPGAEVTPGPVVPSVTSYVQRLDVDGRPLYAKASVCGVSLVSVLRGACGGDLPAVRARQAAYLTSPGSLVDREAAQLRALSGPAALASAHPAGHAVGVLFTAPVDGPTLAELMTTEPGRTRELLDLVVRDVAEGLARAGVTAAVTAGQIRERGISTSFARKFNGLSGLLYLNATGCGDILDVVVVRLRRARRSPALPGRGAVVFGDLKPEHARFPGGADRPVYLDPGLMLGHPVADTAKLVSRTVLELIGSRPPTGTADTILAGLDSHVRATARRLPAAEREAWLHELAVLILMDTVSILTTYLTAPADLPLSLHAAQVRTRAREVTELLDRATAPLQTSTDGPALWRLYLTHARKAVRT